MFLTFTDYSLVIIYVYVTERISRLVKYECEYWLVQKAIHDKTTLNELFEQVYPIVQKYISILAKNSLLNADDKQDITNDAMLECFRKLELYNGESKFHVYACGFARIIFLRYRKSGAIQNSREVVLDHEDISENPSLAILEAIDLYNRNPLHIIIEKDEKERIIASIRDLKPEYRQVIELRLFAEKSEKEIAVTTGCSEDAVSKRYRRALIKVREQLFK